MTSTSYIPGPDGKRIAITVSSSMNFMSMNERHFLMDPEESPYHAPPRDINPPRMLDITELPESDREFHVKELCERCSTMNLGNLHSLSNQKDWDDAEDSCRDSDGEGNLEEGSRIEGHVCDLGQFPEDFRLSNCTFCQTLASIRTRLMKSPIGNPPWPYELHAVSATYVHFGDHRAGKANIPEILATRRISDTIIFSVDPKPPHIFFPGRVGYWLTEHSGTSGYLYPVASKEAVAERKFTGRKLYPDSIDYTVLKSWIDYCKLFHSGCDPTRYSSFKEIPSFRAIDCYTRQVIPLNREEPYVALSYTWGSAHASRDIVAPLDTSLNTVALVIEDAMTVTKALGLRYLWVDKYCIVQDDPLEKMKQIQVMDVVYAGAEVAIIAAAGEDASFGLPGVSRRHRIPQPSTQIGGQLLVSSGPHLQDLLRLSKWASRAWTYQEGLLPKRRIIFTEYQTYFECSSSQCSESIDAPSDVLFEELTIKGAHSTASCHFRFFPPGEPVSKAHQVLKRIEDYASKSLTYSSDALNGILGIFATLERREPITVHLWGIPILTLTEIDQLPFLSPRPQAAKPELIKRDLMEALLFGLRWNIRPGKRNLEFPSWSWTGWVAPLNLHFEPANVAWAIRERPPRTRFWVETLDGSVIDWAEFHTSEVYQGRLPAVSTFLHIEGLVTKLKFNFGKISGPSEAFMYERDIFAPYVRLNINELQISICPLHATKWEDDTKAFIEILVNGTWEALILSHRGSPLPPETDILEKEVKISYKSLAKEEQTDFELLVLESVGDSYERLGTVKLVFPNRLELPSPGELIVTRKRLRLG